jgi:hypothetical protein
MTTILDGEDDSIGPGSPSIAVWSLDGNNVALKNPNEDILQFQRRSDIS